MCLYVSVCVSVCERVCVYLSIQNPKGVFRFSEYILPHPQAMSGCHTVYIQIDKQRSSHALSQGPGVIQAINCVNTVPFSHLVASLCSSFFWFPCGFVRTAVSFEVARH